MITPKEPAQSVLQDFFHPRLLASRPYSIDNTQRQIKLDQNENPFDLDESLKRRVSERLLSIPWNRYPAPFAKDVARIISQYAQVDEACVITAPGSNLLLTIIIQALTTQLHGKIIIARPSFPLYEDYCQNLNLPYEPWLLDKNLDYDLATLPEVTPGSVILFASPNNPVGNVLRKSDFAQLLSTYPHSLFVADEAYFEFAKEPYTDLLGEFANLILVRTFSKTLGAAGVRIGYALGHEKWIAQINKLRLPYLLNVFSLVAVQEIFADSGLRARLNKNVQLLCQERDKLFLKLQTLAKEKNFWVKESQANFLLLRFTSTDACQKAYAHLLKDNIQVRNVSGGAGLAGCLRVSIGKNMENQQFLQSLMTFKN